MFFLRRRKKNPGIPVTPENLVVMSQQKKLTPFEHRLFAQVIKQARRKAAAARQKLETHQRSKVTPIPLDKQDAVMSGVGTRRSLVALFIFGFPLAAVGLMGTHHEWLGVGVLFLAALGVVVCKAWDQWQLNRMTLAEPELRALRAVATADPVARPLYVQWKKESPVFTQRDFQLMENWVGTQAEAKRWDFVEDLLKSKPSHRESKRARRVFGRH